MPTTYWVTVKGRYIVDGAVIDCTDCGTDRGLTFTTAGTCRAVTGSCPRGHIWDERRVSGVLVREAAIAGRR